MTRTCAAGLISPATRRRLAHLLRGIVESCTTACPSRPFAGRAIGSHGPPRTCLRWRSVSSGPKRSTPSASPACGCSSVTAAGRCTSTVTDTIWFEAAREAVAALDPGDYERSSIRDH